MIGVPPTAGFFSKWYLVLGALRNNASWILAGGCLVGLVAPARILAVLLHGGEWTFDALAVEIVTLAAACATAVVIRRTAAEPSA